MNGKRSWMVFESFIDAILNAGHERDQRDIARQNAHLLALSEEQQRLTVDAQRLDNQEKEERLAEERLRREMTQISIDKEREELERQRDPEHWLSDTGDHLYKEGVQMVGRTASADICLGRNMKDRKVGATLVGHVVMGARQRSGKNKLFIDSLLKTWPHNAVIVDPSLDAAKTNAERRSEQQGQEVVIVSAGYKVPQQLTAFLHTINALEGIDPFGPDADRKLEIRAEAVLTLHNQDHAEWHNTAILHTKGIWAFLVVGAQNGLLDEFNLLWGMNLKADLPSAKTLFDADDTVLFGIPKRDSDGNIVTGEGGAIVYRKPGLKQILTLNDDRFPNPLIEITSQCAAQLSKESRELGRQAWKQCGRQFAWLANPHLADCVRKSTFDISRIAYEDIDVFIGLPGGIESEQSAPLQRLIIALVTEAMNEKFKAQGEGGKTTLLVLDDYPMLGDMSRVLGTKTLGALFKTGLICWFIVQNLSQLYDTYGREATEAILSECPVQIFFCLSFQRDLEYLSERCGTNRFTGKPYLMPHEIREIIRRVEIRRNGRKFGIPRRIIALLPDMPDTVILKPMLPDWMAHDSSQ